MYYTRARYAYHSQFRLAKTDTRTAVWTRVGPIKMIYEIAGQQQTSQRFWQRRAFVIRKRRLKAAAPMTRLLKINFSIRLRRRRTRYSVTTSCSVVKYVVHIRLGDGSRSGEPIYRVLSADSPPVTGSGIVRPPSISVVPLIVSGAAEIDRPACVTRFEWATILR